MATRLQYEFETRAGTFRIKQKPNGKWEAMFEEEALGTYQTPDCALEGLISGTINPSSSADNSPPEDLSDWDLIRASTT